jgi:hypothetical protein
MPFQSSSKNRGSGGELDVGGSYHWFFLLSSRFDGSEAVVSKRPMAVTVRTRRERLSLRGKSSNL